MKLNIQQYPNIYANCSYSDIEQPCSGSIVLSEHIQNNADSAQFGLSRQQQPKEKSFFEKYWSKLLLGVGIALGIVLIHGKFWGKRTPKIEQFIKKPFPNSDATTIGSKVTKEIVPEIKINKIGNGRIEVNRTNTSGVNEVFELPEYMYHITSSDNINSILQDNKLNKSVNEQLTGIFLIDSQNFINHYQKIDVGNGKTLDLITTLFKQATKCHSKNTTLASQKVHIIKIPTAELVRNGKLRVRCQEDFFKTKVKLLSLQTKSAQKINVRDMGDAAKRDILKQNLLSNGMNEADADIFLKEIEDKLHQGYTLQKASKSNLENFNAIEYIYNQDIDFSTIKGIENKEINLADIVTVSQNKEVIDKSKLTTVFNNTYQVVNKAGN